jgi:hypothetical protein
MIKPKITIADLPYTIQQEIYADQELIESISNFISMLKKNFHSSNSANRRMKNAIQACEELLE